MFPFCGYQLDGVLCCTKVQTQVIKKQSWTSAHRCAKGFPDYYFFIFFNTLRFGDFGDLGYFVYFDDFGDFKSLNPYISKFLNPQIPKYQNPQIPKSLNP